MSGHVHNYQRFTNVVQGPSGQLQIPCVVAGAGGYTKLGKLHKINNVYPTPPLDLGGGLTLEQYEQDNFGFLRLEVGKGQIVGTYFSAPYAVSGVPTATIADSFVVDLANHTVVTGTSVPGGGGGKPGPGPKPKPKPNKPPKKKKR